MQSTMANKNPGTSGTTNVEEFSYKLKEIVRKAYKKKKMNYDLPGEIQKLLSFYKSGENINYITMKAILTMPIFDKTSNVIVTLEHVLNYFRKDFHDMIISYAHRIHCLEAIEECCLECDHLKSREILACIVQYFIFSGIVDRMSVLDFHDELCVKDSRFLEQKSYRVTMEWVENGITNLCGPGEYLYWAYADKDYVRCTAHRRPPLVFTNDVITFVGNIIEMNGHPQKPGKRQTDIDTESDDSSEEENKEEESEEEESEEENCGPVRYYKDYTV